MTIQKLAVSSLHNIKCAALSLAIAQGLFATASSAFAQDVQADSTAVEAKPKVATVDAKQLDEVYVTGSRLKRVDSETALPVEIVSRAEIEERGVTTAAEIVKSLSANTAPLGDGASITAGTSGQRGFNGANLRGVGVSSTLILLNGRRLANFASPGDEAGVDLNNIPAGAIERVEVLKDGASALYGSDAIGGVINFITRKNYQGLDLSLSAADTGEGGAEKQTATISGGFGDMETDQYNVFGVVDVQHLGALRSSQRDFIAQRPLATLLPALLSSNTYPANVDISSAQRNALIAAGLLPAGTTRNRINPSSPGCNPPATVYSPRGPGGPVACSYDYMQDTEIYPESDKLGFVGRAARQIADGHQIFAEASYAQAQTTYRLSPNPQRIRSLPISILPQAYRTALSAAGLPSTVSGIRLRMTEAGNRTNEVTSSGTRFVLGAEGYFAKWHYDSALARSENQAVDQYVDGYVLYDRFVAGVAAGTINAFGPSSAAGQTLIDSIKINDKARKSKGISQSIDLNLNRSLMALDGGDLGLALGGEIRRETQTFTPSALLLSNNIAGDRDNGAAAGSTTDLAATRDGRNIASAYAELDAPFTSQLEMQAALRFDDYQEVGSTINPKIGLRYQPNSQLVIRGSAGTGFRAPSLNDLHRPTVFGTTSSLITDPQCAAAEQSIDLCTDQFPIERRSNPNLDPEHSRQFSIGAVFEPSKQWNIGLDYWLLRKSDVISTLGEQVIIENPARYNGRIIERDRDGFITNIILQKENQGKLRTSGVDLSSKISSEETDLGTFSADITGTVVLNYERQFGPLEPYRSNLGRFLNDQVIQRWRHRLAFNWDKNAFGLTLANTFLSGYTDQNTTYDPYTDTRLPARSVKPYSLWDITGRYDFNDKLTVRAGMLNVLDKAPPFSNQAYFFLAGFDPTYTDPRGRSFYIGLDYKFF
jgi:iron complex outermembrane recepter protein